MLKRTSSQKKHHHQWHHRRRDIFAKWASSLLRWSVKKASSPERPYHQRGTIAKDSSSSNGTHRQTVINANEAIIAKDIIGIIPKYVLEDNQNHCYSLVFTLFCTTKVWSVYLFQLQGNSNQDTNSLLRLPAINLDKSESPAPKILNWIQDNAMHSSKKRVYVFQITIWMLKNVMIGDVIYNLSNMLLKSFPKLEINLPVNQEIRPISKYCSK